MSLIPLVNVGWIFPFLEILEEAGVSSDRVLRGADLPSLAIDDDSILVPTDRIYRFVAIATQVSGIDDLGIQAGLRFDIEQLVPEADSLGRQPGVFASLESFIDIALKSSSNVDMWIESVPGQKGHIRFFYKGTFGPENSAFPTVEQFMVTLMIRLVRHAAGPDWCPRLVNFRSKSVPIKATRRLAGEADIRCGETTTSILFPGQPWIDRGKQMPKRGSVAWHRHHRELENWREGGDLVGSLRLVLPSYLPDGSVDIKTAANLANTSVRTLQRRLSEQRLTFSDLIEELRYETAIGLLGDPSAKVSDVGRELGYRDPAIFTRAFRRWTGQTPSQFRRSISV